MCLSHVRSEPVLKADGVRNTVRTGESERYRRAETSRCSCKFDVTDLSPHTKS